jgi:hypothetical protein
MRNLSASESSLLISVKAGRLLCIGYTLSRSASRILRGRAGFLECDREWTCYTTSSSIACMPYSPSTPAVKRSITVRPEIDAAVLAIVGKREYSKFANDALLLALQVRGVEEAEAVLERRYGALTTEDHAEAQRRLVQAEGRAAKRLGKRKRKTSA